MNGPRIGLFSLLLAALLAGMSISIAFCQASSDTSAPPSSATGAVKPYSVDLAMIVSMVIIFMIVYAAHRFIWPVRAEGKCEVCGGVAAMRYVPGSVAHKVSATGPGAVMTTMHQWKWSSSRLCLKCSKPLCFVAGCRLPAAVTIGHKFGFPQGQRTIWVDNDVFACQNHGPIIRRIQRAHTCRSPLSLQARSALGSLSS